MGWPYFLYSMLVRVSMESADTLPRGYPWVGYTTYVCPTLVRLSMESADTLCQRGIYGLATLCMTNIGQSIHGICG